MPQAAPEQMPRPAPSREAQAAALVQVTLNPGVKRWVRRGFWIGIALAAAGWLAYVVREIWLPIIIAFVIAMVLDPVVDRMEHRGWKRGWAALVIFAGFFAAVGGILYFAAPAVVQQAAAISDQVGQYIPMPGHERRAEQSLTRLLDRAHTPAYVRAAIVNGSAALTAELRRSGAWLGAHAVQVLSNLIWLVIVPLVTFYALKDFHLILAKALLLVPRDRRDLVQTMTAEVTTIFAKFLRGLATVAALDGVATWLLLLVLRTPNAFTLGAIAGVLYTVPYIGALMTVVLIAGVAFMHGGLQYMLIVVACNVVLHQGIFDQIISPRILGGHVGLHPILSIIALLCGNVLLGVVGMVLAVPVAACIQLLIVTLVPKLGHDIALPANVHAPPDTIASLAEETKEEQVARDATQELHRSVTEAVDQIEAQAAATEQQDTASEANRAA